MDDAEEAIIDLGSVTLQVFHSPLQTNHTKEVGRSFGNVGEGDTLKIRKGCVCWGGNIEHAAKTLEELN